jgi:hypothetical protein
MSDSVNGNGLVELSYRSVMRCALELSCDDTARARGISGEVLLVDGHHTGGRRGNAMQSFGAFREEGR